MLDILLFFAVIYSLVSTVRVVVKVFQGMLLLNKAEKNNDVIIKCRSTVYKLKNYLFVIGIELVILYFWIWIISNLRDTLFNNVLYVIALIDSAVMILVHIIAIFREKHAYLTPDGLVYFMGCFKFAKCRFMWEAESDPDTLSDTLHVYPPKDNYPFTAVFDENIEDAHRIVSVNQQPGA